MSLTEAANPARRVLFASLIGTTIEYFDFYIYGTAAVLVFPALFFPKDDPTSATLQSLATFALAFLARPVGSLVFGHFGDRVGRKATLVAALLTMGLSTVIIGVLPVHASIGVLAPLLLALCRFGQGFGLGGEWGGAVLLATENAPPDKRALFGMAPQLGTPLGFWLSTGVFLWLTFALDDADFMAWGWRLPFIASALLVFVGLYVRLRLEETPAFRRVIEQDQRVRVPVAAVCLQHGRALLLGTGMAVSTFVVFYLVAVFALSWGTAELGYTRREFLVLQMIAVLCLAVTTPLSAMLANRHGTRRVLIFSAACVVAFGLLFAPLFRGGSSASLLAFLGAGFAVVGVTWGPLGTALAQLFPAPVRYTGASLSFNAAGILGASLAPYVATWLATHHGLAYVGYYTSFAGLVSLAALLAKQRSFP